jgi:hypothetical protein
VNPAEAGVLKTSLFLSSPTFYSIGDQGGAARSFPVGAMLTAQRWFGAAALALQHVDNQNGFEDVWPLIEPAWSTWCCVNPQTLADTQGRNLYATGLVGRRFDGWAIGFGVSGAALEAMDGVDLLYAGADRIEQSGTTSDLRVGITVDGDRDRWAFVAAHSRVSMTHDVTFSQWVWTDSLSEPEFEVRTDQNRDENRSWGARGSWRRTLNANGWTVGSSLTVNRKSHPKIPNYTLQNIPRDPGTTWAYEAGIGLAMTQASTSFAIDAVLQPIWSTTWQEANDDDVQASQGRLAIGDRSIENDFFFTNVVMRSGLSHRVGPAELLAGVELRSYDYELDQVDHVESTFRDQRESWLEWSPTAGAVFVLPTLEIRYTGRMTAGTGRPGVANDRFMAEASTDFLVAPEAPLTLRETRVMTHQFSVAIPIR